MNRLNLKKAFPLFLAAGVLLIGAFSFVPSTFAQSTGYTVRSGDTLGSIALAHRVTVVSLLAANPSIADPQRIFVGQVLAIPSANLQPGQSIWAGFAFTGTGTPSGIPVTGATPSPGGTYTVRRGDTLGAIALAHRVTVVTLLAANPSIQNPARIFTGQVLTIPAPDLQPGQSVWAGFNFGAPIPATGGSPTPTPGRTPTG